jgi:N-acetylmuramoyl-L-alanine amidase
MGIFVTAFTAFLQGESRSAAAEHALLASTAQAVPTGPPIAPRPTTAATQSQERPQERVARDDDRRDWRDRRRNRYPGPIPGPEDWQPPEGPVRIALQAGHWRADEAPHELSGLRGNGTRWESMAEWEANLAIAREAGALLEEMGYEVDILPAVVPPGYRAHLFISIHADGSADPRASGYRVAAPRRDATGRAEGVAALLNDRYGKATGLRQIPSVTRRMRNYYAFNYRRYEHALHPMTIGVILETGFLTSATDRRVIVDDPSRAARGIVEAVAAFEETSLPVIAAGAGS